MAQKFFNLKISLPAVPDAPNEQNEDGYQYNLRVDFDNSDYLARVEADRKRVAEFDCLAPVSLEILLELFPFVFVFNSELTIIAIGDTLRKMYPGNALMGRQLTHVTRLRRPKSVLSWANVTYYRLIKV